MIVRYYKSQDLKYTSRKRYQSFNFEPFAQEEQRTVLLGDGANTTVKTSVANICDYVTIDDTRWFVLYHTYMNGGQVTLYLQRDVFGENGILSCFGKIERGYTETFLRNRKELSLNQILKKRTALKPNTNIYGNYTVNNHENELWGVLYLVKPTELDPSTGQPYPETVNINIPAFAPNVVDYTFIENGTTTLYNYDYEGSISFNLRIEGLNKYYRIEIYFSLGGTYTYKKSEITYNEGYSIDVVLYNGDTLITTVTGNGLSDAAIAEVVEGLVSKIANSFIANSKTPNTVFGIPNTPEITDIEGSKYDGVVIKKDDKYYSYSATNKTGFDDAKVGSDDELKKYIRKSIHQKSLVAGGKILTIYANYYSQKINSATSVIKLDFNYITYRILTPTEIGDLTIDVSQQLVDEPYSILVFPLYNVNISLGQTTYSIDKTIAFTIFNTVIQYLSGENSYLVDAQVYPYCPDLIKVSSEIKGYPFFTINSTSFTTVSEVQLLPYSDIKKEYIERQYSIVSPEQSGNFVFNFYDYKNKINDTNGLNYEMLRVDIKTSLKPFSIIASAVIRPDIDALNGITYDSDVRGCQPSSNGFECSLSSNAFQQYKRQNSNYQQIFALQKEELQKQHQVERVNEKTSGIVNTLSASMMGAIGGASLGSGPISKAIGGVAGGLAAGTIVGSAMNKQYRENEKLRAYEESLQQQKFDLEIGTIKNLPNSVNRISSFNEIILKNFYFCIETYECSELEKVIVNNFIEKYSYGIGVFDFYSNYSKPGWFIRGTLITSNFDVNLHNIAETELKGGIYLYD